MHSTEPIDTIKNSVKPFNTLDQHPLTAGTIGIASAAISALLESLHAVAGFASDIGSVAAAVTSVVMAMIVVRRWKTEGESKSKTEDDPSNPS